MSEIQLIEVETSLSLPNEYKTFLIELKEKIRSARLKAVLAVNHELVRLYWHVGKQIINKQNWGSKFIDTLSNDLRQSFPETHGFSVRNLHRMRQLAIYYPDFTILPQAVAELPWGHISLLMQTVKDNSIRIWYAEQAVDQGWSRATLERHVKDNLYQRQAIESNKASNYLQRLPPVQSVLAQDLLKSPYNFDFLGLHDEAHERQIEHTSIEHITKFMLELGKSFAFVGRQVPITIDDEEFFIDMLFYNLKLRCFLVVEIKSTKFKPEHTGQLNFYLSAVDDLMKHPTDNPSVGLLLCKTRNKTVAEYALKSIEKPIGVSEYQLIRSIPEDLKTNFPTIEEIEFELNEVK